MKNTKDPAIDVEALLDQAEAFVRAGDYTDALARAYAAQDGVGARTPPCTRSRARQAVARYEELSRQVRASDRARSASHVVAERQAIGGDGPRPVLRLSAFREALAWMKRARRPLAGTRG